MRKILTWFLLCGLLLSLVGCGSLEKQSENPHIRGVITSIDKDIAGNVTWIMVEGIIEEDTDYDKASIRIEEGTLLIDDGGTNLDEADFFNGMVVEVWFTGSVAESYPVQATAKEIRILDEVIEINLNFEAQPPVGLEKGEPTAELEHVETLDLSGEFDNGEVKVHLYRKIPDKDMEDIGLGEIYAFLENKENIFTLGEVASRGLDSFAIELEDVTGDGHKEIIIEGILGATYIQTSIIGKDEEGNWLLWLQGGSYEVVDLDGDGVKEWVAVSRGSIPPFVFINHWREGMFHLADVSKALGVNFATLKEEGEQWIIEAGLLRLNKATNEFALTSKDFLYREGKLIEFRD